MTAAALIFGAEASCGLLFVVAGSGKASQAARGRESDTALRRLLRVPSRRWRWVEFGTGIVEIATAVAVAFWPVIAGAVMAALGVVFCGLLWRVKAAGIPGGCNCLGARRYAAEGVGVRDIIRAGLLAVTGVAAGVTLGWDGEPFGLSMVAGFAVVSLVLVALSMPPVRRACNRPLLSPVSGTLKALTGHILYQSMSASAGPFASEAGYRRAGCDDEFWFVPRAGGTPVVFAVGHNGTGSGQGLTIRMTQAKADTAMPARKVAVPQP
ncbi:MAG: hypothetical protein FWE35_15530 [Streptosporangiales bacterium]|nr:hypothetical protein [Streptosporangiales bacterium]